MKPTKIDDTKIVLPVLLVDKAKNQIEAKSIINRVFL